jgi:uncharacterized protein YqjF (DUF2071 family)
MKTILFFLLLLPSAFAFSQSTQEDQPFTTSFKTFDYIDGKRLDVYKGSTFVSLVGFIFRNTSIFKIPIPFFGTFEEINLRFYVRR